MNLKYCCYVGLGAMAMLVMSPGIASATILSHHAFAWWDDPVMGVMVTPKGALPPTAASIHMLDLDEWHLDVAQTHAWYSGGPVAGLPANPFGGAAVIGALPGLPAIAEAFVYEISNTGFVHGNGFSFSDPIPPGPGTNYLSGINIIDTHGALGISAPAPGTQFMSTMGGAGWVLDLTPGHVLGTLQDWDFNAFSGAGSFEWDIPNEPGPVHPVAGLLNRPGVTAGMTGVFGYAMPGRWLDAVNDGWVHSWNQEIDLGGVPIPSVQVNITPTVLGFSGPLIPEPVTLALLGLGGLVVCKRRR